MSNSIFENQSSILDGIIKRQVQCGGREELKDFVKRILKQKRLTLKDVQQRSGGSITQAYVSAIVRGVYTNLTVEKLKALARGLGVEEDKIFRVARGVSSEEAFSEKGNNLYQITYFLDLMQQVADNPQLLEIIDELLRMPSDTQAILLKYIKAIKEPKDRDHLKNKIG